MGYHYDAATDTWIKSDHSADNEHDNLDVVFEDFSALEHVPPPASSSQASQPSYEINNAILAAMRSLRNDVRGLLKEVQSHKKDVKSWLSTLETQMASLLARFPSTPRFSPHNDD